MDNYDLLLNEIKTFLVQEEIKEEDTNVEVISLYDLYSIINNELEELRSLTQNSKLDKKLKKSKLQVSLSNKYFHSRTAAYQTYSSIDLIRYDKDNYYRDTFSIYKDKGSDQIRLSAEKNEYNKCFYNIVKNHYDLILEILNKLEYYVELLGDLKVNNSSYIYNLFNVELNFDRRGNVEFNININRNHKLYDECNKVWYKRETIPEFLKKHQEEILKRLPISIYELTGNFKVLYEEHMRKKEETPKVKVKR